MHESAWARSPVGRLDGLALKGAQGAQAPHLIRLQELAHVRAPGGGMPGLALLLLLRRVQHTYTVRSKARGACLRRYIM